MRVRNIANSKGGVAKTTTTFQLAYERASAGKAVLLVDGDSQRSLTTNMGMEPKPGQHTVFALLTDPGRGIKHIVRPYVGTPSHPITFPSGGRIDLIPGAKQIAEAPTVFDRSSDRQPVRSFEQVLPYVISTFCGEYDDIFLDPSPSRDRITDALLFAADSIIAPLACEYMAIDGAQALLEALQASNARREALQVQRQTELEGILIAKVLPDQERLLLGRLFATLDANSIPHFGSLYIPYTTPGWESPKDRVPIAVYSAEDAAAKAYHDLAATL